MRPVPERARAYLLAHPTQPARIGASDLDIPRQVYYEYRSALIREGAIPSRHARYDLADVEERLLDGATAKQIACALGVHHKSVTERLIRAGQPVGELCRDHVYSAAALSRMLGFHCLARVKQWHAAGLLRATPAIGRGGKWLVTAVALQEFLEHPACPVDPSRIADPDWRAYALAARAGHIAPPRPIVEPPPGKALCPACRERVVSRTGRVCRSCGARKGREATHAPR